MNSSNEGTLIVGAGLAAVSAVEAMRAAGAKGDIIMVGDEGEMPYHRPPLSKHFLTGEPIPAEEMLLRPSSFYFDQRVELESGDPVVAVLTAARVARLASGRRIPFDKLLIATGARARQLSVPGAELDGVVTLRTLADARRLRDLLRASERVLVVGAGPIGLEVASTARAAGKRVLVVERSAGVLGRILDIRLSPVVEALHRDHGVDIHLGAHVVGIRGHSRAEEVVLSTGEVLPADLVVVAIGVEPAVGFQIDDDLRSDKGIVVDEFTRTARAGIYAAGDVACSWNPHVRSFVRLEQVGNARAQGAAAGRAMAGMLEAYAPVPRVASQQHRARLQMFGSTSDPGASVHVRGDLAARSFIAFLVRDGRVSGAVVMNRARDAPAVRAIVEAGEALPAERPDEDGSPIAADRP